mmetsp:Transcript_58222/g.125892  ORF Transcript_58222/g.125892 Transcript_58222/m.125892 type:complete len:364 (-) Transcript_58222:120-1211(-)|eukprot:CAMPEP_0170645978 /NCGR_PEP_ID=MMETSP0224-20130122/43380_1 /TAXON_ID=285029 /ORGANISM="Togula jolla, Strain CCCM 725" /LENGTH=363 /DNA_ID=CAMNT_0010977255 /DNA_START=115 /DNA_END=1206 /DNA_ORIENTATION=+
MALGFARVGPRLARHASGLATPGTPRIMRSDVSDIVFHFAVEEHFMNSGKLAGPLMYLWRPSPVVTIGRHQNPWKECVLSRMEAEGVALVRRRTGGGAIFQDPGCSVFTFLGPSDSFSIDKNFDVILGALNRCGIKAERQGRNDLTVNGKKISGSAFRHAPDRKVSLHHGTVLVNTDMQALQRYLTPDKRKLEAKGIASIAARVMNLQESFPEFNHDVLCEGFIAEFREAYDAQEVPVETLDESSGVAVDPAFRALRDELEDKEWRFGRTPEFSHQLETRIDGVGVFDVRLQVIEGRVSQAVIFSDALYPDVIDGAMKALVGADYGREGIRKALESLQPLCMEDGPKKLLHALVDWLVANVDD